MSTEVATIKSIRAREILDSRGNPTVEVSQALKKLIRSRGPSAKCVGTGAFPDLQK